MIDFLELSPVEKREFIQKASLNKNLSPLFIEKDFWVCWILQKIFSLTDLSPLIFKGGTSLSKGFSLINRFSEDIDLTVDRKAFGFHEETLSFSSRKKRDLYIQEMVTSCVSYIQKKIFPTLKRSINDSLKDNPWTLEIEKDNSQNIRFYYPSVLDETNPYVKSSILLEIGIRGDINPSENIFVTPYLIEEFSHFLMMDKIQINTLSPLRTFWEKATLLHMEANRPVEKLTPPRLSRHYYDLVMMYANKLGQEAIKENKILEDVLRNKESFFYASWANYPLAKKHQIQLFPQIARIEDLKKDYKLMEFMIFGNKPSFEEILIKIKEMEECIHLTA